MNKDDLRSLWEAVYRNKLEIEALKGMILHRNDGAAKQHEAVYAEIKRLPEGEEHVGAMAAFNRMALRTSRLSEIIANECAESKNEP